MFLTLGLFESTINSDVFYAWLTQDLLPKAPAGAVIVMDNASFHKRQDMVTAINHAGCVLEFLPPYSPDLNPIEKKWAQAKAIRKQYHCNVDDLFSVHLHRQGWSWITVRSKHPKSDPIAQTGFKKTLPPKSVNCSRKG